MALSRREQVLQALLGGLQTIAGATVKRNEPLPEKMPAGGLVILRDGEPGEPEILLSPLTYLWTHQASVDVVVGGATSADRDAALDTLLQRIGGALAADRTLGGLCDRIEPGAPETDNIVIEGAAPFRGAVIPVTLIYASADPLA